MVELYIEGHKVDLAGDPKISFNYSSIDVDEPAAIKNSFSTTLKVPGTKDNNNLFGHIWKIDRFLIGSSPNADITINENEPLDKSMFTNFDATKRVDFRLYKNGDIAESGYAQLTDIEVKNNQVTYSIVLYGGIGNFFYTLMYSEEEKEKSLKDLYFGWKPTLKEENKSVLGIWNKEFIKDTWDYIKRPDAKKVNITSRFNWMDGLAVNVNVGDFNYADGFKACSSVNIRDYAGQVIEFTFPFIGKDDRVNEDFGFVITDLYGKVVYSEKFSKQTNEGSDNFGRGVHKVRVKLLDDRYVWLKTTYWQSDAYGPFEATITNEDSPVKLDITAIPCYNGLNDDFDNDKCLFDHRNILNTNADPKNDYFPITYKDNDKTYGLYKGRWALIETPRELVEWEARDLRSSQQRVGVKFSSVFNAICDARNNGGFSIYLDDEIKNSDYFNNTYIMLNKPDWEEYISGKDIVGTLGIGSTQLESSGYLRTSEGTDIIDLTDIDKPRIKASMTLEFEFSGSDANNMLNNATTYYKSDEGSWIKNRWNYQFIWQGYAMRFEVYDADTGKYYGCTPTTFLYSPFRFGSTAYGFSKHKDGTTYADRHLLSVLNTQHYAGKTANVIVPKTFYIETGTTDGITYTYDADLDIDNLLYQADGLERIRIKLDVVKCYCSCSYKYQKRNNPGEYTWVAGLGGEQTNRKGQVWRSGNCISTSFVVNSGVVYDNNLSSSISESHITKDVLFGNSKSPYKYLVDFTKMFGLKYLYDNSSNSVYIYKRENYYTGETKELNIDLNKGVKLIPTNTTNRWYNLGLETPETYASYLYNKKNTTDYGSVRIGTDYQFNNEEKDLLGDNIYKNLIPYRLSSYYFKQASLPSIILSPTYKYRMFEDNGDDTIDIDVSKQWNVIKSDYNKKYNDTANRLCVFDKENKSMEDVDNALVFYNGYHASDMRLSDDIDEMFEINENPCYIYSVNSDVALQNVEIPIFDKCNNYNNGFIAIKYLSSLDFGKPSSVFGDTQITYDQECTIYEKYWKNYLSDIYNDNTKVIEVQAFLTEKPSEAMRKFYYYDNAFWVISQITNYVIDSQEPVKMKLVKVNDRLNYSYEREMISGGLSEDNQYIYYSIEVNPDVIYLDYDETDIDIEVKGYFTQGRTKTEVPVGITSAWSWVKSATTSHITVEENTSDEEREAEVTYYLLDEPDEYVRVRIVQQSFAVPDTGNNTIHYKTTNNEPITKCMAGNKVVEIKDLDWGNSQFVSNRYYPELDCCVIKFRNDINHIPDNLFNFFNDQTRDNLRLQEIVHLPDTVTKIGNYFCQGCQKLINVYLDNLTGTLTEVGDFFLRNVYGIKTFSCTPFSAVTKLGNYFLMECYYLERIDLTGLENIEFVGDQFLYYADSLKEINFTPMTKVEKFGDSMLGRSFPANIYIMQNRIFPLSTLSCNSQYMSIYVPCELVDEYKRRFPDYKDCFKCVEDDDSTQYFISVEPNVANVSFASGSIDVNVTAYKQIGNYKFYLDVEVEKPTWVFSADNRFIFYSMNRGVEPRSGEVIYHIKENPSMTASITINQDAYVEQYQFFVLPTEELHVSWELGVTELIVKAYRTYDGSNTEVKVLLADKPTWVNYADGSVVSYFENTTSYERRGVLNFYVEENPEYVVSVGIVQDVYGYNVSYPDNEIHYKTSDNKPIETLYDSNVWIEKMIANRYDENLGHCVASFHNAVTTIPFFFLEQSETLTEIIYLPSTIDDIWEWFLYSCPNLERVNLRSLINVPEIQNYFIYNCPKLKTVSFTGMKKVSKIGVGLLGRSGIEVVDFHGLENVESIRNSFMVETPVKSVDLSPFKSVKKLEYSPFYGCTNLNDITVNQQRIFPLDELSYGTPDSLKSIFVPCNLVSNYKSSLPQLSKYIAPIVGCPPEEGDDPRPETATYSLLISPENEYVSTDAGSIYVNVLATKTVGNSSSPVGYSVRDDYPDWVKIDGNIVNFEKNYTLKRNANITFYINEHPSTMTTLHLYQDGIEYEFGITPSYISALSTESSNPISVVAYRRLGDVRTPVSVSVKSGYASWIKSATTSMIVCDENTTTQQRSTEVVFYVDEYPDAMASIMVYQRGIEYKLTVEPSYISAPYIDVKYPLTITATKTHGTEVTPVSFSYDSEFEDWVSMSDDYVVSLTKNEGETTRSASIRFYIDEYPIRSYELSIVQTPFRGTIYENNVIQYRMESGSGSGLSYLNWNDNRIISNTYYSDGDYYLAIFEKDVTEIPDDFFYAKKISELMYLPSTITKIGNNFMGQCTSIETLNLTGLESVKSIGSFFLSGGLFKNVTITGLKNVTEIGEYFMLNCESMITLNLRGLESVKSIGDHFLQNNRGLETLQLSKLEHLETIGNNFMYSCWKIKSIDLTSCKRLKTIGNNFMDQCTSLEKVNIAGLENLESIGSTFNVGNSKHIDISGLKNLKSIGSYFGQSKTECETIDLTGLENLESIGDYFFYMSSIEIIDLSSLKNLKYIGSHFLANCEKIKVIDLSAFDNVISIGSNFLFTCSNLLFIDLSHLTNLKIVYSGFLSYCAKLNSIDFTGLGNVEEIYDGFLSHCTGFTTISCKGLEGVKAIGSSFLYGCDNLSTINFNGLENVEIIGKNASFGGGFIQGLNNIKSIDFTGLDSVKEIAQYCICECANLEYIDLSGFKSLNSAPDGCFTGLSSIKTITINKDSVFEFSTHAVVDLMGSQTLQSIYVPASLVDSYKAKYSSLSSYIKPIAQ